MTVPTPDPIPDPMNCGFGQGEGFCAFLTVGGGGFQCGRTDRSIEATVRGRLAGGAMAAKHDPGDTPYPDCRPS